MDQKKLDNLLVRYPAGRAGIAGIPTDRQGSTTTGDILMGIQGRGNSVRDTPRQNPEKNIIFRESRLIALCYWFMVLLVFAVLSFIVLMRPAHACDHDCEPSPRPQNVHFDGDKNQAVAGVVIGALVACGVVSIINQRWCWEPEPKPIFPAPGQTPHEVTR